MKGEGKNVREVEDEEGQEEGGGGGESEEEAKVSSDAVVCSFIYVFPVFVAQRVRAGVTLHHR